ncbi:MAG: regulatory protein RecX [Methanosarcinaceae archaeon]
MEKKNEALKFAMKLISLRRRSFFEIRKRLEKKSYEEIIIKEVLKELKNYRYLDDKQFAESYINDRINFRPCGNFLIRKELKEKGIEENIINEKMEELLSEEEEIESAKKLVKKKLKIINDKTDEIKVNQKLKLFLQSKGYSFDIINQAVKINKEYEE